ncbi:MAG: hypothetical protein WAL59_02295 [Roseiarcus sp.]
MSSPTWLDAAQGRKPGDLPVEITMLIRTVVNLKAANALGPTAPGTLLARAVDMIE